MEEGLIKRLMASIKCGTCGQHYKEEHIDVIEHSEGLWLMQVSCLSCNVRCLVVAIIRDDEKAEAITDLNQLELDKFKGADEVGVDDVLDMRNFLKDFDGDFPRIFQQK
jgi:formate dehydrogenase maturation protein FdhE